MNLMHNGLCIAMLAPCDTALGHSTSLWSLLLVLTDYVWHT